MPPGSIRYFSWLFAAPEAREPLLGMYALMAEWRALMDPATEASVAHIKLDWWRGEIARLTDRTPAHPITRYLAAMPRATGMDFAALERTLSAASAQVAGAPLERAAELAAHSSALYGLPLLIAGRLAGSDDAGGAQSGEGFEACIDALAAAEYLRRAVADYQRDARAGRVPFAVDELLAHGIEDADLASSDPPPALAGYLMQLRTGTRALGTDAAAAMHAMPPRARSQHRHLAVLLTLERKRDRENRSPSDSDFRLSDLYNAWSAARHAARGR